MATTTEPPWLNMAAGTAARNGTTSHTISFGFTSTPTTLLAVFIHGAVTNTATGWTKQAGPVATGECSLFTKTSAGDASITVTHNGSNYLVNYVVYEFPAGSTLTGVDSTTGSSDVMVGLTGLPGTAQVVLGAVGRVAIGSETGASATWANPWVEDGDLFAAASGTDGTYLTVGHQINVTATTITPATSISYTGTWGNGQREKISAAFNVAALAGAITRTVDDPAGLTDTTATASTFTRSATDPTGLVDSQARALGLALTDLAGAADAQSAAGAFARTQTDTAGLSDATSAVSAFARTQTDSAGLADAATQQLFTLITRTVADLVGLADLGAPQALDVTETVADAVGLTDTTVPVLTSNGLAISRTADDTTGLADVIAAAAGFARTVADTTGTTDLVTAVGSYARAIADSAGLIDSASTQLAGAGIRQVDDSAGLSDALTISSAQTVADGLGLADALLVALTASRSAADLIGLSDSVTPQLNATAAHVRTITDSVGLTSEHRCQRLTSRPLAGTTIRPNVGTTSRYALVSD